MKTNTFIVKVQLSIVTNTGSKQVLIYDKERDIMWEGEASEGIINAMKGRDKAFFNAEIINKKIILQSEAKWQNW